MPTHPADQQRMIELLDGLNAPEGARPSALEGVLLLRTTCNTPPVPVLYEPCIVLVAQGTKRFHLPDRVVTYDAGHYLVLTVPAPAGCQTEVAAHGPFLGLAVRIDLSLLSDLLLKLNATPSPPYRRPSPPHARQSLQPTRPISSSDEWVSAPPMTPVIRNVTLRLLESLASPADAAILGPQLVRELTYRVLLGEGGSHLYDLLLTNSARTQIHRILHRMHTSFADPLDIPTLARDAGMSVSALHLHFKAVTATSPVQYLKTIRLHKARMLMVQDALGAAAAAARVGYDSTSQFSREFKRLFGAPPAGETQRVRATFGLPQTSTALPQTSVA